MARRPLPTLAGSREAESGREARLEKRPAPRKPPESREPEEGLGISHGNIDGATLPGPKRRSEAQETPGASPRKSWGLFGWIKQEAAQPERARIPECRAGDSERHAGIRESDSRHVPGLTAPLPPKEQRTPGFGSKVAPGRGFGKANLREAARNPRIRVWKER